MLITLAGCTREMTPGASVMQILTALCPDQAKTALGAMRGGEVLALDTPVTGDAALEIITFSDDEGRRIYERSLRLLLLASVESLYPGCHVRILNSIGYGVFMKLPRMPLSKVEVLRLERTMRQLANENHPIITQVWDKQDAIDYYNQNGLKDEAQALERTAGGTVSMSSLLGVSRYCFGALLPATGALNVFLLRQYYPGFVLQMPAPEAPQVPAPYVSRPKHLSVFAQSQYWCEVLGATTAADINRMLKADDFRQFIRINEALHDKSIAAIADDAAARKARCILVAGPSSSGKTTFSNRLAIHLRVLGMHPAVVSLDNFYLNRDTYPVNEDGTVDYEDIARLDLDLFDQCIESLMLGAETELPVYDFGSGSRLETGKRVRLGPNDPVIIEGIHALNPRVSRDMNGDWVFKVYVSALSCVNMDDENRVRTTDLRLIRRIVRDMRSRNTPPNETMDTWPSVRAGEDKWIFPFQESADAMFNTSLHYELPVLKTSAYESLSSIQRQDPHFLFADRLKNILDCFDEIPASVMDEIPPLSILREFIGGCTLYD